MISSATDLVSELAPSGTLRAAINLGNVVLAHQDAAGALGGVTVDLARALAAELELPLELIAYPTAGAVIPGLAKDAWDIAFLAAEPERAAVIQFTAPYVYIDATYLVRDEAPFQSAAEVDAEGVRVTVVKGAAYDLALTRLLRSATLVRADSWPESIALLMEGGLDAAAGIRQALDDAVKPGFRVIADRFSRVEQGMATPQGRPLAARHVAAFLEEKKASGFIRDALDRHGQKSATVAPAAIVP